MSDTLLVDTARRFGGMERLYGPGCLATLEAAHVAVAGIGGVGSWCVEGLVRSGVGAVTLADLDHVAESNVNRQIHALSETFGQSKVAAMAARIHGINPRCRVRTLDEFVDAGNVAHLFSSAVDLVIDCTDQISAKIAMILAGREQGVPVLVCGGAGGKTDPYSLRATDLSQARNDALLAKLRNQLRRQHGYASGSDRAGKPRKRVPRMGVRALWFDQPAILPARWQPESEPGSRPQGLSCAGYGSVVSVTATMGMAAVNEALRCLLKNPIP